ncbi:MAG: HAD family hydrolase [Hyphomicrobiaceae bacterium]
MTNLPKAVFFDLDGTLVDSIGDIRHALNLAVSLKGVGPFDEAAVRTMVGAGAVKLIIRAMLSAQMTPNQFDAQYLKAAFIAAYKASSHEKTKVYPNARETLEVLRASGCKVAVVSNKPHELTEKAVDGLKLSPLFDAVLGGSDAHALKPSGAMILAVADGMGLSPDNIIMVGDSANDVEAARAAGCRVVVVDYGYSDRPARELEADGVISCLSELPGLLSKIA